MTGKPNKKYIYLAAQHLTRSGSTRPTLGNLKILSCGGAGSLSTVANLSWSAPDAYL